MRQKESRQDFQFPIYGEVSDLPFDEIPAFLKEGVAGICLEGSATVEVFGHPHSVGKNDLLVLFPYIQACMKERSSDFGMRFFKVPASLFHDIMSGLYALTLDFYFWMQRHCTYRLTDNEVARFLHFLDLVRMRAEHPLRWFRKDSVIQILHVFYLDLYVAYQARPAAQKKIAYSHKENIAYRFIGLMMEHLPESRELLFYAQKMNLTPKYLTQVMSEMSGRSAQEWIISFTLYAIKGHLQNFDLSVKEVAALAGFPSQSNMSRFFKHYTGISPTGFRNTFIGKPESDE